MKFTNHNASLGLTSYAADENADRMAKANEKVSESSKKRSEKIGESYDQEIAMAKIAGKDTTQLELDKSRALEKESIKRKNAAKKALEAMRHQEGEEATKKRQELRKQIDAESKLIQSGVNERKRIKAQELADQKEADKKAGDEAVEESRKVAYDISLLAKNEIKSAGYSRTKANPELTKSRVGTNIPMVLLSIKLLQVLCEMHDYQGH